MRQPFPSEMPSITSNNLSDLLDQIENIQGKIGLGVGEKGLELLLPVRPLQRAFRAIGTTRR